MARKGTRKATSVCHLRRRFSPRSAAARDREEFASNRATNPVADRLRHSRRGEPIARSRGALNLRSPCHRARGARRRHPVKLGKQAARTNSVGRSSGAPQACCSREARETREGIRALSPRPVRGSGERPHNRQRKTGRRPGSEDRPAPRQRKTGRRSGSGRRQPATRAAETGRRSRQAEDPRLVAASFRAVRAAERQRTTSKLGMCNSPSPRLRDRFPALRWRPGYRRCTKSSS